MATRNLARTVVERGRSKNFRDMEAWYTRAERQAARQVLSRIHTVDDALEEGPSTGKRRQDWDCGFADSLSVAERFLQARAGQPWDKVYSELCSKYDRRTMKGRHLIDLHVVNHLVDKPESNRFRFGIRTADLPRQGAWVDAHGILRYTQRSKWWLNRKK